MIHGTLLEDVKIMSDALRTESAIYVIMFYFFVLMSAFTIMNMLIGVLCEVVSAVAATEKEELLLSYVKGKVQKIVEEIDEDGDQSISRAEFEHILGNAQACRALQDVGVDVIGLVDGAD